VAPATGKPAPLPGTAHGGAGAAPAGGDEVRAGEAGIRPGRPDPGPQ